MAADVGEGESHLGWLVSRLQAFRREGRFTDVTVTVQDRHFHCHRLVLAAFSRVLKAMLRTDMREGVERKVALGGVTALTFQHVLDFMYGVDFSMEEEEDGDWAVDLLQASDMLDVPALKLVCAARLAKRLTPECCLDAWALARTHACPGLARDARVYAARHFRAVCKTPGFLRLEADQVQSLLEDDELAAPVEEEVFYALCNWAGAARRDSESRRRQAERLLPLVRFPLMDPVLLGESIARRMAALGSERGQELLREAQEYHASFDLRHLLTSPRTEPRAASPLMAAVVVLGNQLGEEGCFSLLAYSLRERLWRACTHRLELPVGCALCPWGGGFYSAGGLLSSQVLYHDLHGRGPPMRARCGQKGTAGLVRVCADMPCSLIHHSLLAFGRRLFLFGGWRWQGQRSGAEEGWDGNPTVLEYDTSRDVWRLAGVMADGPRRIQGHVRHGRRILAYSVAGGLSLQYFDTDTRHSARLTLPALARLPRPPAAPLEVFDVCPLSPRHHALVSGSGDVVVVHPGSNDDIRAEMGQIPLSQEMKMFSAAQVRGRLYVLGGMAEEGEEGEGGQGSVCQCQGLERSFEVVRVPGPYRRTWAYSCFYMNVSKSRFQKVLSKSLLTGKCQRAS